MLLKLIKKELRQHRSVFTATLLAAVTLPWVIVAIDRADGMKRTIEQRFLLDLSIALVMTYFCPSMIAFWLMATERTKRTLLIFRMLPVETDYAMGAKELAGSVGVICIASCNLISFVLAFHLLIGSAPHFLTILGGIKTLLLLLVYLQLSLWLFLTFDQKWATQAPFLFAIMIRPLWLVAQNYVGAGGNAISRLASDLLIPCAIASLFLLHRAMCKAFDSQDWTMPTIE